MPVTMAVAAAVSATTAAAGAALAGSAITGAMLASAAISGALAAGLAYLARPDEPDDQSVGAGDLRQTVTAAVSPARWVMGRARVGGVMVYAGEDANDDAVLWLVLAISEGPIDSVERIWLGDESIPFTRTADGVITPDPSSEYHGHMTLWEVFAGDGATDGAGPTALRAATGGEWTTEHQLNGIAYVVARLTQGSGADGSVFAGVPNFNFLVKGMKITWPGQSTPTWTENAAALRWWYMRTVRGLPEAAFDTASVTEAIAWCGAANIPVNRPDSSYRDWPEAEMRYAVNGVVQSGDPVERVEAELDFCWQGYAVEMDGVYHFRPGRDRASVATVEDDDILELLVCTPFPTQQARVNAVTMSLRQSARHDYLEYAAPEVANSASVTRDGRQPKDLGTRPYVNSPSAADRMLNIFLRRANASFQATYLLSPRNDLRWAELMPTEIVLVNDRTLGLVNWRAMVVETTVHDDWSVEVMLEDCPDQTFADTPGTGRPGRSYLRVPRQSTPPGEVANASASVVPRETPDRGVVWQVVVTAPSSALPLHGRLVVDGQMADEKVTQGSTLEFDVNTARADMTVTVWRQTGAGVRGPTRTLTVTPQYTDLTIPTATLESYRPYRGILRVALADPKTRNVAGAVFRAFTVDADSATDPKAITAERWDDAERLDSLAVLLTPGSPAVFNVVFPRTAKYRIAARYADSVGRLGPVTELGVFLLAVPLGDRETILGAPNWEGTSQHLGAALHGAETLLLPDRDDIANLTEAEWNGYQSANLPQKYQTRHKAGSGAYGSWTDRANTASGVTITGLANGTAHTFQVRRVDDGGNQAAATVTATPRAAATTPEKPTLSLAAGSTTLTLTASVTEDSRAPVTSWQYRYATTATGLSSASWNTVSDSDDPSVTATITGLTAGTTYHVQVRAVNSVGNGTASDAASATTVNAVPPKPTLTLTAPAAGAYLKLSASVTGSSGVTSWEYQKATTLAGLSSATWSVLSGQSGNSATGSVQNLNLSTTYHVRVRARNAAGYSTASDAQSATTSDTASPFTGGSGTVPDPYVIADLADFDSAQNILPFFVRPTISMNFTLASSLTVTVYVDNGTGSNNQGVGRLYSGDSIVAVGSSIGPPWILRVGPATLAAGTYRIYVSPPVGVPEVNMRIITAPAGAGGLTEPLGAYPPDGFALAKVGTSGVRATWAAPPLVHGDQTLEGYQLEVQLTAGGAWTAWPGTLPPDTTTLTVPAGVSGDNAWRIRAVYAGGATGTEYSDWETASVADLFADADSFAAGAAALSLTATESDGEVTLSWTDPNLRVASVWPFGDCEGYDQAFNAATSTWWRSEMLDLGATKGVEVSVNVEHYEPPLRVSGASGAVGAVVNASADDGPAFTSDLGVQVWVTGAAITDTTLPFAEAGGQEVTYRVDGLPRGVHVGDVRNLTGTPTLAAGTEGVARVTATTPDGLTDTSYFAWQLVAAATKTGTGTETDPYVLGSAAVGAEVRDWLRPGATNAADLPSAGGAARSVPTYFQVTVPAGEVWAFNLWDPDGGGDGEDFDLVSFPEGAGDVFHVTTGGRERHVVDNSAGASAATRKVGVYVHASATNADQVNANVEGEAAKAKVNVSWSPEPETGQALADEWGGYASAATGSAYAPNSESVTDVYVLSGTSQASLTRTKITGAHSVTARYIQAELHLRKWRGRALRQATVEVRET